MNGIRGLLSMALAVMALACARQDASHLRRRNVAPPAASGWARVVLDAEAQRDEAGLWISDATGRSVPFLRIREGLWAPQPLEVQHLNLGMDDQGRPSADFEVKLPPSWQGGERARLRVDLDLQGEAPWVAAVAAARERQGGGFLAYDAAPEHLYDLSPSGRQNSLHLPWDGDRYRLALRTEQGRVPRIAGLRVWAETPPEAVSPTVLQATTVVPVAGKAGFWRVSLAGPDRVAGLEVVLVPPAAPLRVEVLSEAQDGASLGSAQLWNLPALDSRATRLDLPGTVTQSLLLRLTEGARPESVQARIRRETLAFPVEAGQGYALHLGGAARPAPGDLGALPSSRILLSAAPLPLGPATPDPDGLPRRVEAGTRARSWMPWVAGLAVLLLAAVAWRLLEASKPA
jgi:hypothetical protein